MLETAQKSKMAMLPLYKCFLCLFLSLLVANALPKMASQNPHFTREKLVLEGEN
jgi:hypothetical protein